MSADVTWYAAPDGQTMTRRAAEAFAGAFGAPPDGVWAAPGRVNLIGEHVDYNRGLCLPFALAQRTFVALRARPDRTVRVRSAQEPDGWEGTFEEIDPLLSPRWAGYAVGVPWAMRAAGHDVPGVDVFVDSQLPRGAGLSSSAALECAVAIGLDDVARLGLTEDDDGRKQLAAACVRAENEIAGAPTGGLDQAAALRSRDGHAFVLDCADFSLRQLPLDLHAAGLAVLVIDTRAHHALVDGQYGSRRDACEDACRILGVASLREVEPGTLGDTLSRLPADELRRRVRHVVTEIERVRTTAALLDRGALELVGPVLDASHRSLREDYEVSCPELDLACERAVAAGALGARMTGGGFGGSAIALVPLGREHHVAETVSTGFAAAGMTPPAFLLATPSGPAGRTA